MLNLAHYLHPNFRLLWRRHRNQVILVFVIFMVFFISREFYTKPKYPQKTRSARDSDNDDELIMLRQVFLEYFIFLTVMSNSS